MTKHNKDTDKLKSPNIRKILINNAKIIYKSNGDARSVMVIVVGNGHGDTSSNPGRD